jgi:uncharacterized protein
MSDLHHNDQLRATLAQVRWHARPERFVMAGLAPRERLLALRLLSGVSSSFWQFVVEPDLLTLIVAEQEWRRISPGFPHARVERYYRVITFDLDLPADLVGFLAAISAALADAGVPLLAICGYTKDHLLVREENLAQALAAIEALVARFRGPQP